MKKPLAYGAGQQGETAGGLPPQGGASSIDDFDYQFKYQRAFEAVLWDMPAVAIYSFRRAAFDNLGLKNNDIIAYSKPATPHPRHPGGHFMFASLTWKGETPASVTEVIRVDSDILKLMGRIMAASPEDTKVALGYMDDWNIRTLSAYPGGPGPKATVHHWPEPAKTNWLQCVNFVLCGGDMGTADKKWIDQYKDAGIGQWGLPPEESVYLQIAKGSDDQNVNSSNGKKYRMDFKAPNVSQFWSFTDYGTDNMLMAHNAIIRHSRGDRTLKPDADGMYTVDLSAEGDASNPDWLPLPEKDAYIIMRLYGPDQDAIEGKYPTPTLEVVK